MVCERASYYECALMSRAQYVYVLNGNGFLAWIRGRENINQDEIPSNPLNDELQRMGWNVYQIKRDESCKFLATIYSNEERRQVVVAYRGTNTITALIQGYKEIWCSRIGKQKENSFLLISEAIKIAELMSLNARITFTGHSLGGFLSITSLFFATYEKNRLSAGAVETSSKEFLRLNSVAFESPGQLDSLQKLQPTQEEFHVDLQGLDIISFLAYPNYINTIDSHVGTLVMMDLPLVQNPGNIDYLKKSHSSEAILEWSKSYEDESESGKPKFIKSWPKWRTALYFFKHYKQTPEGKYELTELDEKDWFDLCYKDKFQLLDSASAKQLNQMLPMRNFDKGLQEFLRRFLNQSRKNLDRILCQNILALLKGYRIESFGDKIDKTEFVIYEGEGGILEFRSQVSCWFDDVKNIEIYLEDAQVMPQSEPGVSFISGKNIKISGKPKFEGNAVYGTSVTVENGVDPQTLAVLGLGDFVKKESSPGTPVSFVHGTGSVDISDTVEWKNNTVQEKGLEVVNRIEN